MSNKAFWEEWNWDENEHFTDDRCDCSICRWVQQNYERKQEWTEIDEYTKTLKKLDEVIKQYKIPIQKNNDQNQPQISEKAKKLLKKLFGYYFRDAEQQEEYVELCKYINELEQGF